MKEAIALKGKFWAWVRAQPISASSIQRGCPAETSLTCPMRCPSTMSSWSNTHLSCWKNSPSFSPKYSPAHHHHHHWVPTLGMGLTSTMPLFFVMGCLDFRKWSTSSGMVGKASPSKRYRFWKRAPHHYSVITLLLPLLHFPQRNKILIPIFQASWLEHYSTLELYSTYKEFPSS